MAIESAARMNRFIARLGQGCPRCGGFLEFGWDDHEPVATCLMCSRQQRANAIPPLTDIMAYEDEPDYYQNVNTQKRRWIGSRLGRQWQELDGAA